MHEDLAFRGTVPESCDVTPRTPDLDERATKVNSKHKRVLLTGATGFLGGAFLAHARD
ncbi:MAG: hypothetical protein JWN04_2454, partial [Myxococcaceae bacterium]|nr:hypothetical protein [Myxococcaceae bacterium]